MKPFNFRKFRRMVSTKKLWVIIPFLLSLLAGFTYVLATPKIYEAKVLILMQTQTGPDDSVEALDSNHVLTTLVSIFELMTGRENLEKIIDSYQLYDESGSNLSVNEKLALFRKNISVDMGAKDKVPSTETTIFEIRFRGKDPVKAREVTNTLASNLILENLKTRYDSVLEKKEKAGASGGIEQEQKEKQFRILDAAKTPTIPVEPCLPKVILFALAVGLSLGCGLAFFMEKIDVSYRTPEEVEKDLGLPVLMSIPIQYSKRESRSIKRKKILAFAFVTVGFTLSAAGIAFALKGIDKTVDFLRQFLSGI